MASNVQHSASFEKSILRITQRAHRSHKGPSAFSMDRQLPIISRLHLCFLVKISKQFLLSKSFDMVIHQVTSSWIFMDIITCKHRWHTFCFPVWFINQSSAQLGHQRCYLTFQILPFILKEKRKAQKNQFLNYLFIQFHYALETDFFFNAVTQLNSLMSKPCQQMFGISEISENTVLCESV